MSLSPTAPARWTLARLRTAASDPSQFSDADVLGFINDGYAEACEHSRCLRTYTVIPTIVGQQEYALPANWVETLGVFVDGLEQRPLPMRTAPRGDIGFYYYSYGQVVGLVTAPVQAGSLVLHYCYSPVALALDDTPDSQFGPEWYFLLRHYAAWRSFILMGDAFAKLGLGERALFDAGVDQLQRTVNRDRTAQARVKHIMEDYTMRSAMFRQIVRKDVAV